MSDPNQSGGPPPPANAPRDDVPLEVQYPPPPRPPHASSVQTSQQAGAAADSAYEEKEAVVAPPTSGAQIKPYDPSHYPPSPHTGTQVQAQQPPHNGQASYVPPIAPSTSAQQHSTPDIKLPSGETVTSLPYRVQDPGASQQHPASTASSSKQQEHEQHGQGEEHHDAPPPYTLEDNGLYGPPMPPRPDEQHAVPSATGAIAELPSPVSASSEAPPALPPRPQHPSLVYQGSFPTSAASSFPDDDPSNPVHYTRDPHRLVGYLVPFPKPKIPGIDPAQIPTRFLIYTPPPPPLQAPAEGEKESRATKLQRKWQTEVREAKQSDAKLASWKGVKSRATKGISWAMGAVKSAEIEFLNRVPAAPSGKARAPSPNPGASTDGQPHDVHSHDGQEGNDHRTVGLEALDLIYPPSLANGVPGGEQGLRAEFINSMMRTRSKAQKDAVIATGLLPVSAAIDILATLIWPFGGLLEVDGVWAYASIRGAKTARSVTKRLASSTNNDTQMSDHKQDTKESLALHFVASSRIEVLKRYLGAKCAERDPGMFAWAREGGVAPTESVVLSAIGWEPSKSGDETRNWEDEQWERQEVKDDLKMVMGKAARSWDKWCKAFEKNPEKALKK